PTRCIVVSAGISRTSANPIGSPLSLAVILPWILPVDGPARAAGATTEKSTKSAAAHPYRSGRAARRGCAAQLIRPLPSIDPNDLPGGLGAVGEHLVEVHAAGRVPIDPPLEVVRAGRKLTRRER